MSGHDRYAHIVAAVRDQPWALLPSKLAAIVSLLELRAAGVTLTEQDIQARLGGPPPEAPDAMMTAGGVAVLPLFGIISQRMNLFAAMSGGTSTEQFAANFRTLRDNPQVRALVVPIDSPGGGVYGVEELATEIRESRGTKPIVFVADSMAASAAYWIGAQGDELVVTPGGDVGSIGIFAAHQDLSASLEKTGVKTTIVKAGKFKAEGNPFEPLDEEARAAMQGRVDAAYARFIHAVAEGRDVSQKAVREGFGQGRLVNANDALRAGMVDQIATLDQVIERVEKRLGKSSARSAVRAEERPSLDTSQEPAKATDQDRVADKRWQQARVFEADLSAL